MPKHSQDPSNWIWNWNLESTITVTFTQWLTRCMAKVHEVHEGVIDKLVCSGRRKWIKQLLSHAQSNKWKNSSPRCQVTGSWNSLALMRGRSSQYVMSNHNHWWNLGPPFPTIDQRTVETVETSRVSCSQESQIWDAEGVFLVDNLETGHTITGAEYDLLRQPQENEEDSMWEADKRSAAPPGQNPTSQRRCTFCDLCFQL